MITMDKKEIERSVESLERAKPGINFVETDNGWKLKVSAFGFAEWFNVSYLNKVLEDSPYKVVNEEASDQDSDEGDEW